MRFSKHWKIRGAVFQSLENGLCYGLMFRHFTAVCVFAAVASSAWAWQSYQFDLPSQAPEALWRDYLSEELGAQHEVAVEGGRIDVMTDTEAIEIDWPHKWHEGLGQCLHYADVTGKKPVLALISYGQGPDKMQAASRERFEMVERICAKQGVRLIVLFPAQPKIYGVDTNQIALVAQSTNYWINTKTGIRHHLGCRFYGTGLEGHTCGEKDGKPCTICCGKRAITASPGQ